MTAPWISLHSIECGCNAGVMQIPDPTMRFHKIAVQGILERGGEIRAHVIDNSRIGNVVPNVEASVEKGSHVYTDQLRSYFQLQGEYVHGVINHAEMYVNGQIHTNGLENFWSLLKRGLGGTYVSVEPFHLFRYV